MADAEKFEGWFVVELMGHRRLAGFVSQVEIAGQPFLRLDVPHEQPVTQFYSAGAVYCMTPTTEEIAKAVAAKSRPAPVSPFELPRLTERVTTANEVDYDEAEDDDAGDDDIPY